MSLEIFPRTQPLPKTTITEAPVDAMADGGHFATMPKDISHVTFVFDETPENLEDRRFFFAKVETTDAVNDDLDTWYDAALAEILARNADLAEGSLLGVAIKFGSGKGGTGGEFFYAIDGDSTDIDDAPYGSNLRADVEYSYASLF